jgi:cytoskeleton protein RodZ
MAEIGSTLREARMRARIDISEVEARTKIRAKYLRAIENEEWDLLPGSVYVKSFLRTYGDFLGLDSRLLVDEFKRRYERPDDHEVRAISPIGRERVGRERVGRERGGRERGGRERPPRRSGGRASSSRRLTTRIPRSPLMVIAVALVVIVVGLYEIGSNTTNSNSNSPSQHAGNTTTTTANTTHHKKHKHHGSNTTTDKQTTTTATSATPPPPSEATLAMVATGTVWVCEVGEPGNKLLIGGLDYLAGQRIPTQHARKILVSLGNSEVDVRANGKPYTVAHGSGLALRVTPSGVTPLTTTPPGCG